MKTGTTKTGPVPQQEEQLSESQNHEKCSKSNAVSLKCYVKSAGYKATLTDVSSCLRTQNLIPKNSDKADKTTKKAIYYDGWSQIYDVVRGGILACQNRTLRDSEQYRSSVSSGTD